MTRSDVNRERGASRRPLAWFGRKKDRGDERPGETGVASALADFLVQVTEGQALRQAIDARRRELERGKRELTDDLRRSSRNEVR